MNRRHFLFAAAGLALSARAAQPQPRLRVGVIGDSARGLYGHGLDVVWLSMPETQIVAAADPVAAGLAKELKRLKITRGFADYRKMLAEMRPEIVAICPRFIDQHHAMAMAAIEAGARGLYIEKPFCRTPAEADEIIAACTRKKVRLAVAHRNRYHPVLAVVNRLVKEGAIGRLLELRARGKEDERGGALDLWVLGSHALNLAAHLAGKPLACSAMLMQNGRPVTRAEIKEGDEGVGLLGGNEVHARYEMENGLPLYFDSIKGGGKGGANFGLQLIGSEGIIDLRVDREPLAHLIAGSPFQPTDKPRPWVPISSAGPGLPEPIANLGNLVSSHLLAARDLLSAIREGREPLCNAAEGALTVEMIAAVFESHRMGGARVTLPLQTRGNPLALFS